jgi:hypothetical protein
VSEMTERQRTSFDAQCAQVLTIAERMPDED